MEENDCDRTLASGMTVKRAIALLSFLVVVVSCPDLAAQNEPPSETVETFADWCLNRASLTLEAEQWSRLKAEYEAVAQYRYTEEDRNSRSFSSEEEAAAISHVSWFLTSDEYSSFPNSYEILIFGFQDNADLDLVICYGVALNADPPEIVYWTNG